MKSTPRFPLIAFAVVALFGAGSAHAFTYTVPTHFTTIQNAINGASNGDKIRIAPGTYRENLNLNGKTISLEPVSDFEVIIDGQGGPCLTLSGGEMPSAVIKGLTFANGGGINGGGIKSGSSLATIKNCIIRNNTVTGNGGGIYGHSGIISGCRIIDNVAVQGGGISNVDGPINSNHIARNTATQSGGGIANTAGDIEFNTIKLNSAPVRGGGIADSTSNIRGNAIEQNEVTNAGPQNSPASFGGGLANCTGLIEQNGVVGNASNGNGGGLDNCTSTVRNNIIASNTARHGGGVSAATGRLEHNVIYANSAFYAGGGVRNSVSPVNSVIWGNVAPSGAQISSTNNPPNDPLFSCVQNWMGGGVGNTTVDPQFVKPNAGDFHLQASSPLIDAGKLITDTLFDFENDPRGTASTLVERGDGSKYDIGADEYVPPFVNLTGFWAKATATYKMKSGVPYAKLKAKLAVSCVGNVPTATATEVRYYLSNDANYDGSDQEVGVPKVLNPMKPGKTKNLKLVVKLPAGQLVTGKYLIARIDAPNLILESSESDNVVVAGPLP